MRSEVKGHNGATGSLEVLGQANSATERSVVPVTLIDAAIQLLLATRWKQRWSIVMASIHLIQ